MVVKPTSSLPLDGGGKGGGDLSLEFAQPPKPIRSRGQWPDRIGKIFPGYDTSPMRGGKTCRVDHSKGGRDHG
jgi:hypothetical protein